MLTGERIDCAIQDLKLECANYMADLDCWDEEKTKCKICYIPTALEALEKQIPKKPVMIKDKAETYYICSECEWEVDRFDDNYCSDCGQKLDWRGGEYIETKEKE